MAYSEEQHPNYAARIKALRETQGLSIEEASKAAEISFSNMFDLESYANEVLMCISLSELAILARVLGTYPLELLDPEASMRPEAGLCHNELSRAILQFLERSQQPIEAFEEHVGWEVTEVLNEPEKILNWNVDCLSDVCAAISVNWWDVILGLDDV